jgi:DNA mismatch repair protein MutS2
MTIDSQTLETLEFPKILEQLARHCAFSASRELVESLTPSTDIVEIRDRLKLTSEARNLFDENPDITVGGARDIRSYVERARRGGMLEPSMFLEISSTINSARRLRITLQKLDSEQFVKLQEIAWSLPSLPHLEDTITRTISDDGTVLDSASPKLGQLRSEVRIAFNRLQDKLQNMISSSQYADALQEPLITVRNGRYVVPVKAANRRSIRGLVHDQSSSGATLYIEPIATVDLNNRWRELQLAEEQEVARILGELSDHVGAEATAILAGVEALALLDFCFAKAKYSAALRAVEPEVVSELGPVVHDETGRQAPLQLSQARHPLLDQSKVVPTDIWLGDEFRILLITGPNTGGKTVALKTTGLLALMAQAGLHIPAVAPSRLPVFSQIFADIGDEQSIEQSLSTFSSHMTNIIKILKKIDDPNYGRERKPIKQTNYSEQELEDLSNWRKVQPGEWQPSEALYLEKGNTLVLFDELGAGTDPLEGAALAQAIIERLLERGVLAIATTHYAELKAFAYATDHVVNGSVEFNVETLAPTYKLTIGLPGRSNALAIASRLGLDPSLVERARSTMNHENAAVEDLLAGIHNEREAAAAELARAEELRVDAEKYRDRLAAELQAFEDQRDAEWRAAQQELEDQMREARNQLRRLRDDFSSVTLSRQWMEQAEKRLQEAKANVPERAAPIKKVVPPKPAQPAEQAPRPLRVGDTVLVRTMGLNGDIIAIDEEDKTAEVQVGGFRVQVDLKDLQREKKKTGRTGDTSWAVPPEKPKLPPAPDVSLSLDMRGWRATDVSEKLDRYLNDAYLAGLPYVRLIHGKGTGALRQMVRDILTKHPLISSFGGGGQDGGEGVTVAHLNEQ